MQNNRNMCDRFVRLCCCPCLLCLCLWSVTRTAQRWTRMSSSPPSLTTPCSWPWSLDRHGDHSQYVSPKKHHQYILYSRISCDTDLQSSHQGSVVLKSQGHTRPRNGRDIARVTFDLYKLSPKDMFGSLSVKATFQGLYSVSADFQCLGPKKVLR